MNLGFVILFRVPLFIIALVSATTSHQLCRIGAVTRGVSCNSSEGLLHRRGLQDRTPWKKQIIVKKGNQLHLFQICWGLGEKRLGYRKTKEGGKDREREVEHGPYILQLQLPYGTSTVAPK